MNHNNIHTIFGRFWRSAKEPYQKMKVYPNIKTTNWIRIVQLLSKNSYTLEYEYEGQGKGVDTNLFVFSKDERKVYLLWSKQFEGGLKCSQLDANFINVQLVLNLKEGFSRDISDNVISLIENEISQKRKLSKPSWFKIVSQNDFQPSIFNEHPIWSEFYDFEELFDLINWGVSAIWARMEFQKKKINQAHPYYTMEKNSYPCSNMRYFTKCKFRTINNKVIEGIIINDADLAIGLFLKDEIIIFNNHPDLEEFLKDDLDKIAFHYFLNIQDLKVLEYEAVIKDADGNNIKGKFVMY